MAKKYMTKRIRKAIGSDEQDDLENITRELENSGVNLDRFNDPNIDMAEFEEEDRHE